VKRSFEVAKFLFVYRQNCESYGTTPPEEMQQVLQKWQTWISEGIQKGWMLDAGDALKKEGRVVNAAKLVTDGPFIEVKEIVGGFSIVQANTLDDAAELAKDCPVFLRGGSVEVRPLHGLAMGK
jgi:hypothetical protein